jgi:Spy/CpxP family protein refolding chaperone
MVNAWKPILAALLIFAAGVVTGGLTVRLKSQAPNRPDRLPTQGSDRIWPARRAEADVRDLSQRLQGRLKLTPHQRERIEGIVKESRERMRSIAEDMAPKTREEFRQMRERIREELTPEQRKDFEEVFRQRDAVRHRATGEPPQQPAERP